MKEYVSAIDGMNQILKFILCLILNPIIFGLYRWGKKGLLWGILWFITGGLFAIGWIIDCVTIVVDNKVKLLA